MSATAVGYETRCHHASRQYTAAELLVRRSLGTMSGPPPKSRGSIRFECRRAPQLLRHAGGAVAGSTVIFPIGGRAGRPTARVGPVMIIAAGNARAYPARVAFQTAHPLDVLSKGQR
jgi:hypothetical protein